MRLFPHNLMRVASVAAAVAIASHACADLAPPAPSPSSAYVPVMPRAAVVPVATFGAAHSQTADPLTRPVTLWPEFAFPLTPADTDIGTTGPAPDTLSLPPGPSSISLFLSAFAGFGVWHLGRSVRKIHIVGALPEWYHADARQIGHSTPLDIEFSLAALPVCVFDAPSVIRDEKPGRWRLLLYPVKQFQPQYFLLIADPRGPPFVSM